MEWIKVPAFSFMIAKALVWLISSYLKIMLLVDTELSILKIRSTKAAISWIISQDAKTGRGFRGYEDNVIKFFFFKAEYIFISIETLQKTGMNIFFFLLENSEVLLKIIDLLVEYILSMLEAKSSVLNIICFLLKTVIKLLVFYFILFWWSCEEIFRLLL